MPSTFAHAAAGLGVASLFAPRDATKRYWWTAAACAAIPDLDYIGAPFGNRSIALWFGGHRGFTHSIVFAVLLGAAATWVLFRDDRWAGKRGRLLAAFTLATLTHGLLDALTTQRPPVAFFSPFSTARYTFPWHPIHPSGGGLLALGRVLFNELLWVGVPALVLFGIDLSFRAERRRREVEESQSSR